MDFSCLHWQSLPTLSLLWSSSWHWSSLPLLLCAHSLFFSLSFNPQETSQCAIYQSLLFAPVSPFFLTSFFFLPLSSTREGNENLKASGSHSEVRRLLRRWRWQPGFRRSLWQPASAASWVATCHDPQRLGVSLTSPFFSYSTDETLILLHSPTLLISLTLAWSLLVITLDGREGKDVMYYNNINITYQKNIYIYFFFSHTNWT